MNVSIGPVVFGIIGAVLTSNDSGFFYTGIYVLPLITTGLVVSFLIGIYSLLLIIITGFEVVFGVNGISFFLNNGLNTFGIRVDGI